MQEARLHDNRSCMFLFCYVSFTGFRVYRVPIVNGLPCDIAL
jgi:hypothetical protein